MSLVEKIDRTTVPRHIAIIMDGNGRWAKQRNLDRSQGHRKGLDVVHEITNAAADIGVECLTLYAFSTENWNRPQEEVDALMSLVVFGIERETPGMIANGLSYSARWEIAAAAQRIAQDVLQGITDPCHIDEKLFASYLTTASLPEPDLLIRTGGELRISNFLLWQLAYAEFYFTDEYWPDFTDESLYRAIIDYQKRERRFGKTSEQIQHNDKV